MSISSLNVYQYCGQLKEKKYWEMKYKLFETMMKLIIIRPIFKNLHITYKKLIKNKLFIQNIV